METTTVMVTKIMIKEMEDSDTYEGYIGYSDEHVDGNCDNSSNQEDYRNNNDKKGDRDYKMTTTATKNTRLATANNTEQKM